MRSAHILFDVLDDGGPGWKGFEREEGLRAV